MKWDKKQKALAIVVAAAVLLPLGTAAFFQLRPSADEEISQMQSIVSEYTEDDGYMEPENHEIDESEADALDQAAEDGMSSSVIEGDGQAESTDPGETEPVDPDTETPDETQPHEEVPGDVPQQPGSDAENPEVQEPNTISEPDEPHVQVNVRNWKQYRSSYPYDHMTGAEQALWLRLEAAAEDYMNNSALDAVYSESQDLYTTYSIRYGDLELSRETAVDLTQWFLSCNSQYWFLRPSILSTSKVLYVGMIDLGADGDERAEITNRLFQTVDEWASCMDGATTVYQKVKAVHDKVVSEIGYENGPYDQTVYSAFIERRSVCAGYAGSMSMLLNYGGINATVISSSNHAWNGVQMEDGNWYGLDATWDDCLSTYQFFLVSDPNLRVGDNEKEAHVVTGVSANWAPTLSAYNYNASSYDNTGESQAVSLAAPANLNVEYIDEKAGRARWESVPGAEKYELQIYRNSALCASTNLTGTSIKLSSLSSTPMTVKVRSVRSGQSGIEYSDWASIEYTHGVGTTQDDNQSSGVTVSAPGNLHVVEAAETYVRVGWDEVSGAEKYEVQAYKDANFTVQKLSGSVRSTGVKLSGFSAGQTVYVQVRAIQTMNGVQQQSEWVKLPVTAKAPEKEPEISAPSGIMFQQKTSTSVRATWNAVEGATKYDVEVYKDEAMTQKTVAGTVSSTAVSLSNVKSGKTYYVRVRAKGTIDGYDMVSEWSISSFGDEAPSVDTPANLVVNSVDASAARITWEKPEGASKCEIQISYKSDFSTISAQTSITGSSLKLTQIKSGRTYYIRVRSVGTVNGTAVESDWVTASYTK